MRCKKCGTALISRYDFRTGEEVFICPVCSSDTDELDEMRPQKDIEIKEVNCPVCGGRGEYKGPEDIHKCSKCMGTGTIKVEEIKE